MIHFPKPDVEQFFRTYAITSFAVTKDETRLVFNTNLNGTMNLWAMDLSETFFPYQFAQMDESCSFVKFDPEGRYVLAGFDKDGDENHQIYALPHEGGLPRPLITGDAEDKFFLADLSEDGERLYYATSQGNPSFLNTRIRYLEDGTDELLHEGETAPTILSAVSDDEQSFVYHHQFANTYIPAFVQTDEGAYYLTPDENVVHVADSPIFTDNSTIYFVTDYDKEYSYLAKFDLNDKQFAVELEVEGEDIQAIEWDKHSRILYLVTENGVSDALYQYYVDSGEVDVIEMPVDVVDQFHVGDSGTVYMLGRGATQPPNIYALKGGKDWHPLTNNRVLGIGPSDMVEPEVVSYQSYDGMTIESLLFKPKPGNDNGYTIFWPHGGPQAAERKMFRSMFQSFLNRGYTVFAPNFRGSTGYGSSFVKLVELDWGEGPRLDCVAGIQWLFDQGITDREKLFLVGGSYGGYMALLLHGRHPEYFKAVVDLFGPSDLFTFVNSVPPHWKPIMERWLGDPERDRERFINDSPVTYLDGMSKPMLVIQGAKDPRVVKEESDQIVQKLKDNGRKVEYLVLEDEGHGFSKKENEIEVYKRMLDFLDRHQ